MMTDIFKHTCLLLFLLASVSPYYIKPLRAGTIIVSDADLRSSKLITTLIDLNLSAADYQAHKDINTIAAITSLSMDEHLNFYFNYTVVCPQDHCFLNFTLLRYTDPVSPNFTYRIVADYLVARGLKVRDLNMTSFQEHLFLKEVVSYDKNNVREDLGKDIPFNNEDAWYMLLFPSGFNNLTLTGHVVYSYLLNSDMYVVHFMDHSGAHGEHDSMGWPEKKNYIKYRAVFIPPAYLTAHPSCSPLEKFQLTQHFQKTCDGGSSVKWFAGFKGTKEASIQGELFEQRSGFSFSLAQTPSRYGLMAFPFEADADFVDLRRHEYKWDVEYHQFGVFLGFIILTAISGVVLFLVYNYFKPLLRKTDNKKMFKKVKKYENMHE
jgi:hypothetical protein